MMGSEEQPDESPIHTVELDGFWVKQTEVTNAQYARCVAAGACTPPHNKLWNAPMFANHPVVNIDWNQADGYAEWAGKRLPTEAEWEYVARGEDGRTYPWGNQPPNAQLLNYDLVRGGTTPVGSYPSGVSPFGILDMAGNVEEWIADRYLAEYYASSPAQNPQGPEQGTLRVLRGGSYNSKADVVRAANRERALPNGNYPSVGFRVVVSEP